MKTKDDLHVRPDTGDSEEQTSGEPLALAGPPDEVPDALVPIARSLLPVLSPRNELAVRAAEQESYALRFGTYVGVVERLRRLAEQARHVGAVANRREAALALVQNRHQIALLSVDPLEEARLALGLDRERDKLWQQLLSEISVVRGFQAVASIARERLGATVRNLNELVELMPDISGVELGLFSLLRGLPPIYLGYGTRFDRDAVERLIQETLPFDAANRVPQFAWASTHGVAFVLDNHAQQYEDGGIFDVDPYRILGLTGIRSDVDLVEFRPEIKEMLGQLIMLRISGNRLYEMVWNSAPEALQVGMGRIARHALEEVAPDVARAHSSVSNAIGALSTEQRPKFEEAQARLEARVALASIHDATRNVMLEPQEVVRLVGLVERIPGCLLGQLPFVGYIHSLGTAVRFVSSDGNVVETCQFAANHLHQVVPTLLDETTTAGRENRTMNGIFSELVAEASARVLDAYAEDATAVPPLDRLAYSVWGLRTVHLAHLPRWTLVDVRDFWRDMVRAGRTLTGKDIVATTTKKIGMTEASLYARTLALMPRPLLDHVSSLRKAHGTSSLSEFMSGLTVAGSYEAATQTISIFENNDRTFGAVSPVQRALRGFVAAHECGEGVWTMLTGDEIEEWSRISWSDEAPAREGHFLTFYSHACNAKEDFCDHFACYIMHGPEFRARGESAPALAQKYAFLRRLIARHNEGRPIDYPTVIEFTIEQITGELEQTVRQNSMEEAIEAQEAMTRHVVREARESVAEVIHDVDDIGREEEDEALAEEADDDDDVSDGRDDDDDDEAEERQQDRDLEEDDDPEEDEAVYNFRMLKNEVKYGLECVLDTRHPEFRDFVRRIVALVIDDELKEVTPLLDELVNDGDLSDLVEFLTELSA